MNTKWNYCVSLRDEKTVKHKDSEQLSSHQLLFLCTRSFFPFNHFISYFIL